MKKKIALVLLCAHAHKIPCQKRKTFWTTVLKKFTILKRKEHTTLSHPSVLEKTSDFIEGILNQASVDPVFKNFIVHPIDDSEKIFQAIQNFDPEEIILAKVHDFFSKQASPSLLDAWNEKAQRTGLSPPFSLIAEKLYLSSVEEDDQKRYLCAYAQLIRDSRTRSF